MSDDVSESVGLAIALLIIGGLMVVLGSAFNSPLLGVVGVIIGGALPVLALIVKVIDQL